MSYRGKDMQTQTYNIRDDDDDGKVGDFLRSRANCNFVRRTLKDKQFHYMPGVAQRVPGS